MIAGAETVIQDASHPAHVQLLRVQSEVVALGVVIAEALCEYPRAPLLQAQGQVASLPGFCFLSGKILQGEQIHPLEGAQAPEVDLAFIEFRRIQRNSEGEFQLPQYRPGMRPVAAWTTIRRTWSSGCGGTRCRSRTMGWASSSSKASFT